MTTLAETVFEDSVELVEFRELKNRGSNEFLSEIVSDFGVVYVTALTREGCSGCETQKPMFSARASRLSRENSGKVRFRRLHVDYRDDDKRDSWDSKRAFGHAAYPTYMIHVKSRVGPLEIYRSIYPPMDELEKQVRESFELAEFYKNHAPTPSD